MDCFAPGNPRAVGAPYSVNETRTSGHRSEGADRTKALALAGPAGKIVSAIKTGKEGREGDPEGIEGSRRTSARSAFGRMTRQGPIELFGGWSLGGHGRDGWSKPAR
jgi:hypothetical protein